MLAVASAAIVTAFPLALQGQPQHAAWWGGAFLMLSMLAFIVAFLLAGFITVGYHAPQDSCPALLCKDGGLPCTDLTLAPWNPDDVDGVTDGYLVVDPQVVALNNRVMRQLFVGFSLNTSDTSMVCVVYKQSVTDGNSSTIYPFNIQIFALDDAETFVASGNDSSDANYVQGSLATSEALQRQTACMSADHFPTAIDPSFTNTTRDIAFNLSWPIPDLGAFLIEEDLVLSEFIWVNNDLSLPDYSLFQLPFFCFSDTVDPNNTEPVLCDKTAGGYSVDMNAQYLKPSSVEAAGALLFDRYLTVVQNSTNTAIKLLSAIFAGSCLLVVAFLIRSRCL